MNGAVIVSVSAISSVEVYSRKRSCLLCETINTSSHSPISQTGWRKYAHAPFGLQSCFGVSAPSDVVYKHFGFSVPNLLERAGEVIAFYRPGGVETAHPVAPSLVDYPRFAAVNPLH